MNSMHLDSVVHYGDSANVIIIVYAQADNKQIG
jgi:hypothetical protein